MSAASGGRTRVAAGVAGVLVAVSLAAMWKTPSDDDRQWRAVIECVVGAGFAAAGITVLRAAALPGRLFAAVGALLLAGPVVRAVGPSLAADAGTVFALGVLLPFALFRVVRRELLALRVVEGAALAAGGVCVVATALRAPVAMTFATLAVLALVVCGAWILFETTAGDDRRRVLWLVLGVCVSAPAGSMYLVAAERLPVGAVGVAVVLAVLSLVLPASAVIALVAPKRWDVRDLGRRLTVLVVMLSLVVSVYEGGDSLLTALNGERPDRVVGAVLAGLIAVGYGPASRMVRSVVDELLFGGRAEPIETLSRLGAQLTAGAEPLEWLDALRSALGVPGIVLRQDGLEVAASGRVGEGETAVTPLRTGSEHVGDLVVTLPPELLRLPPATAAVLGLVAVPLAQALHAARLSEQLRQSQGRVVTALEEERRRMRRDLHDGLGPTLTGIAYSADAASNVLHSDPARAYDTLRLLRADASDAIAEVRRIVYGLRPKALDELGLIGAIRQRTGSLHAADGRPLTVTITSPDLPELPAAVEVVAFRVAIEAVTNVARHSTAPTAALTFALPGASLHVTVHDPGASPAWTPGVGLTTMRERVEQIGGTLTLSPTPTGSTVTARLPLSP